MITIHSDTVPLRVDASDTIRVANSRITLDVLLEWVRMGVTAEQLVSADYYPHLALADVRAILAYYDRNKVEIDEYLQRRREEADRMQKQIEATHPSFDEVMARLLAKRKAAHASPAD